MVDPKWSGHKEKAIEHARDALITTFINDGYDVICDDMNLHVPTQNHLKQLAESLGAEFAIQDFTHVPLQECLKRDNLREATARVGERVILENYKRYLTPPKQTQPETIYRQDCIIVDVDGTLADHNGRSPYDESKCGDDLLIEVTDRLVRNFDPCCYRFIFSGRTEAAREDTEEWLALHEIVYDNLYMRQIGDTRPDYVVKEELYRKYVEGKYNVVAVFDDRKQVCLTWKYVLNLPLVYVGDFIDF